MPTEEKVIIRSMSRPSKETVDELVSWFCRSLDLEDTDMEPKMLKEIIDGSFSDTGVTSKELDKELALPRSTVIYHLNKFIEAGLVVRKKRRYYLRAMSMKGTIEGLQDDILREFQHMLEFADKLDSIMSDLYVRGEEGGKRGKGRRSRK